MRSIHWIARAAASNGCHWLVVAALGLAIVPSVDAALVVHYPFAGNGNDISGNGNNGIITGPVGYVAGVNGQAIDFNNPVGFGSATQFVTLPNLTALNSSSFSVAMLIRSTDTSQDNGRLFGNNFSSAGLVFGYSGGNNGPEAGFGVRESTNGFFPSAFGQTAGPEGIVTDGNWHWLIMVVDRAANQFRGYIDLNFQQRDITGLAATSFTNVRLGSGNDTLSGSTATSFAARLTAVDELRIYDHALTPAEAAALVPEPSTLTGLAALGLLMKSGRGRRSR